MTTILYRAWSNGELLYVGITKNLGHRITDHVKREEMRTADVWTVEHHETRAGALAAERWAILHEQPKLNRLVPATFCSRDGVQLFDGRRADFACPFGEKSLRAESHVHPSS